MATSRAIGPFPYYADLFPPPVGYRWVYLSYIVTEERVRSQWATTGVAPFLAPVPRKKEYLTYWDIKQRQDEMEEYGQQQQAKAGKWVPSEDSLIRDFPTLNAFLTDGFWKNGKPREVCSLKFRFGNGSVQMTLSDEDKRMSITTWAETASEAMGLLDEALRDNKVSWRSWGGKNKKN